MALKEMPKVGERVRYLGVSDVFDDLTVGKEYEVRRVDSNEYSEYFEIIDDVKDEAYFYADGFHFFELVSEPQPDVHALLANLGRRIHEVETALAPIPTEEDGPAEATDAVNPAHYKRGKYETIDVIEHITAGYDDPFVAYCVGNAVKYADRAPYKHDSPAECLRKAAWYLTRAADHVDKQAGDSD